MKLHRHLVEQAVAAVTEIFATAKPADKVIERFLKSQRKWGSRDRKFFAETVYEIVRHWRRLWVTAGLDPRAYLDREGISDDDVWKVWARFEWERSGELPDWEEFHGYSFPKVTAGSLPRAVRESVPDWLDAIGAESFGERWPRVLAALNKPADVFLRVNTLKGDRKHLHEKLAKEGVDSVPVEGSEIALRLPVRKNVFITECFKKGLFEVQDAASQTVAPLLDPKPGERVIDGCAGAGGKTLHLAALMKNKGKILALDIHEWKLNELRTRASRAGADIVETRVIEGSKTVKRLAETADAVLLDVPCSGLGVLRRNPDSKWRLSPEEIERLLALQAEILSSSSRMTKPGGRLVYATCSLLPRENEEQVKAFLSRPEGQGWELVEEHHFLPDREGFDGFYAAKLIRANLEGKRT